MNLDFLKPGPVLETVRFESQPPGAEAKVSNGQNCRTPCALALPAGGPYTVTFTLNGYQPESEQIELLSMGDNTSQLQPNPVVVALNPASPPPVRRKPAPRKRVAKPAAKPAAPKTTAPPPPPPPAPPAAASPWPSSPAQR